MKWTGLLVFSAFLLASCSNKRPGQPKVLVFSKTAGFHHNSISDGIATIEKLGRENGFEVDTTANADKFTEENLQQYSAVIFLSTTGNVLNKYQEADFERYIQAGGGYVGIHAAADTEYEWGWYGRLVGGYFLDHPGINDSQPNVQEGRLTIEDDTHPSTEFLPGSWTRVDEWYSYENLNDEVNVLMTLDEDSYKGGADMGRHPIAWYHQYDGGRAFYTGLGHTSESFSEDRYLKHVLAGIQYAIGENLMLDHSKASTARVPEENRFSKEMLTSGQFYEPTEMTILPNRDVLIAQRRGKIKLYKNSDSTLVQAGKLDAYYQTDESGVNAEEGVLGIKADPNFEENKNVFIFYSPADTSVNRLSRFDFEDNRLVTESEEVILQFYSQRHICCHTGGSIAFDSEGLLYLSTGDNTTPFDQENSQYVTDGYAPLDERQGNRQYNALRTAGNANDLRGKILRIRVNEDGSYDIPEGNLYPKGTDGTRPEIYVQGNRNPYRISVDQKNGYLYWGGVGPDAQNDDMQNRGPRGYDEINQAREPGFFGWPMFVGPNYAYKRYNYETGESGKPFDPESPVNDSRLNDGIKELPPAKPAFIWYPYDKSEEFPSVGTGGRNAMAGPVYYTDLYPEESSLPDYFDEKLIIYDWVRNWIKVVTMWPNGDYSKMDPFMDGTEFNAVIDMEVGPEGRLYLLEYGTGWFSKNDDSGLSYIGYNSGNRKPVINDLVVDKTSGVLPLNVKATEQAVDPEQDELSYVWDFGDGTTKNTTEPTAEHTYEQVGEYEVSVEVKDGELSQTSEHVSVYAGNAAPEVNIEVLGTGNKTFYFPNQPVKYQVNVSDKDSEIPDDLSSSSLVVSADYVESSDMSGASQGHEVMTGVMRGRQLVESLNCQSCHNINGESTGPSYTAVAKRYQDSSGVVSYLSDRIIQGGSGVWGETVMPAHPEISESEAEQIVNWIQSLSNEESQSQSLPPKGSVDPTRGEQPTPDGMLILSASYTDRGGPDTKPLTGGTSVRLRNSTMNLTGAKDLEGYTTMTYQDSFLLDVPGERGSFSLGEIDLFGIELVQIGATVGQSVSTEYKLELRLGSSEGTLVAEKVFKPQPTESQYSSQQITIDINKKLNKEEVQDLYFVSEPIDAEGTGMFVFRTIQFIAQE